MKEKTRQELFEVLDSLLSKLKTWLSLKIMTDDVDGFKDFIKYVSRYTASEIQFILEEKGFKPDIEKIIEKIENSEVE